MHIKSATQLSLIINELLKTAHELREAILNKKLDDEYYAAALSRKMFILIYTLYNKQNYTNDTSIDEFKKRFDKEIAPLFAFANIEDYIYWISNSIYIKNNEIDFNSIQDLLFKQIYAIFELLTKIPITDNSINFEIVFQSFINDLNKRSENIAKSDLKTYQNKMNILTAQITYVIIDCKYDINLDKKYKLICSIIMQDLIIINQNANSITDINKNIIINRLCICMEILDRMNIERLLTGKNNIEILINIKISHLNIKDAIIKMDPDKLYFFIKNGDINHLAVINIIKKVFFQEEKNNIVIIKNIFNNNTVYQLNKAEIIELLLNSPDKLLSKRLYNYNFAYFQELSECQCKPELCRNNYIDLRKITEACIIDAAKTLDTNTIHLGIFYSGGLFQTLVIITKLIYVNKIHNLALTLFDDFIYDKNFTKMAQCFFKLLNDLDINFVLNTSVTDVISVQQHTATTTDLATVTISFMPHTDNNPKRKTYDPTELDIVVNCHGSRPIDHELLLSLRAGAYVIESWATDKIAGLIFQIKMDDKNLDNILVLAPIYIPSKIYTISNIKTQSQIVNEFLEENNLHDKAKQRLII